MKNTFTLAVHGGAGTMLATSMTPDIERSYLQGLSDALDAGEEILRKGGSSLDAVTQAVVVLEDCPLFNAGKGAVFTHEGIHELDASIMRGDTLEAGACAGVTGIKNPVQLARLIMEQSEHVMLAGAGAAEFARMHELTFEDAPYFFNEFRYTQYRHALEADGVFLDHDLPGKDKKFGTVGAVAMDTHGNLAAATSTGGMTNKRFMRIGDSPVIGAGTYANNKTCAVSCTGHGEFFLRAVVAYDISCLMEYKGMSLAEASEYVVMKKLVDFGGEGGVISIDAKGNVSMPFNSPGMYRGMTGSEFAKLVSIY